MTEPERLAAYQESQFVWLCPYCAQGGDIEVIFDGLHCHGCGRDWCADGTPKVGA